MEKIKSVVLVLVVLGLTGCMGVPVREAVKVDTTVPVGKIEGNTFTGIRYPFKITAPPGWKVSMEVPDFMESLGYEKDGLEESEVFVFNPETQSNFQIDFVPAGRYAKFSQESIEWIVEGARGSFKEELEKDYGKGINVVYAPTAAYPLRGVPYSAKKYATYSLKGVKREQGWIFGFTEPYQMFILYMILEKEGTPNSDREAMKQALDSFEAYLKK
jgi:hypothetical protein